MTASTKAIAPHETIGAEKSRGGFWDRAYQRFIASREAKARALVAQHLAHMSDERLLDLGFDPAEVRRLRTRAEPFC